MRRMAESLRHAGSSKEAQSSVIGQPITKNNGGGGEWLMEAFLSQASNRKSPERAVDVGRGDADRMVTSRAIQQSQERISTSSSMAPLRVMTQPPPFVPSAAWHGPRTPGTMPPPPPDSNYPLPDYYTHAPHPHLQAPPLPLRQVAPPMRRITGSHSPARGGGSGGLMLQKMASPRSSSEHASSVESRERRASERSSDSRHSSATGSEKTSQSRE